MFNIQRWPAQIPCFESFSLSWLGDANRLTPDLANRGGTSSSYSPLRPVRSCCSTAFCSSVCQWIIRGGSLERSFTIFVIQPCLLYGRRSQVGSLRPQSRASDALFAYDARH